MARASLDAVGETGYISEAFAEPVRGAVAMETRTPTPTGDKGPLTVREPARRRGTSEPIGIEVAHIRKLTRHRVQMREIEIALPADLLQVAEQLEDQYREQILLHISWTRVLELAVQAAYPSPEYALNWVLFRTLRFPAQELVSVAGKRTHRAVMSERLAGWLTAISENGFVLL